MNPKDEPIMNISKMDDFPGDKIFTPRIIDIFLMIAAVILFIGIVQEIVSWSVQGMVDENYRALSSEINSDDKLDDKLNGIKLVVENHTHRYYDGKPFPIKWPAETYRTLGPPQVPYPYNAQYPEYDFGKKGYR